MRLLLGDCREVMRSLPDASVDSVVTDPPYELGFMGKAWDSSGVAYDVSVWRECLRVLKPGGHLLAFGGSRTYHRLACAVEDAGFEIRDQIMWVYGSGFPKSHNLEGAWQGWGTALKPAHEPIVVARRPLIGTVAENVLAFGTGAVNVDGCRVEAQDAEKLARNWERETVTDMRGGNYGNGKASGIALSTVAPFGRWPANLIHDGSAEVVGRFPQTTSGNIVPHHIKGNNARSAFGMKFTTESWNGDSGSAARFFYTAKADAEDRSEGCETPSHHPTVKPTDLMRYLCRLVTPPGGIVLDPFMGSGSTGKAAALERFDFIGIELEPEYLEIARARIAWLGEAPEVTGDLPQRQKEPARGAQLTLAFA